MKDRREAVAIVGMACRLPGGVNDPDSLWEMLTTGRDAITMPPPERAALGWPTRAADSSLWLGGYLQNIDQFDAAFFGISARDALTIDPQQRIMLELAWHALEDAGINALSLKGSNTGVFIGQWTSDFDDEVLAAARGGSDPGVSITTGRYASSGRVSNILESTGPSMTLDAACSSSLVAIHLAARSVAFGECALALAGGANVILNRGIDIAFTKARILSPTGLGRFGDIERDGYVRSEGAGLVVLKSLAAALADGDHVHAVISGSAVNNDGGGAGAMGRPSAAAHAALLRMALSDAGLDASEIGYVEAHGTGTRAGDRVEIGALSEIYGKARKDGVPLPLGALKTNIGHCEAASGVASLIKAVLVTEHGWVPATLHSASPDPEIQWQGCTIAQSAMSWNAGPAPRRAGITTFGVSGTNCHLLIEQGPSYPAASPIEGEAGLCLPLSAGSLASLRILAAKYLQLIERGASLRDTCWCAATRRSALAHRAVFPATSRAALIDALQRVAGGELAVAPADDALAGWMAGRPLDWRSRMQRGVFVKLPLIPWEPLSHWPSAAASIPTPAAVEPTLRGIIAALLKLRADDIDAACPLGDLGLTSLQAVELANGLTASLGLKVPPTFIYDHPTLGAMAEAARRLIATEPSLAPTSALQLELPPDNDIAAQLLAEISRGSGSPRRRSVI